MIENPAGADVFPKVAAAFSVYNEALEASMADPANRELVMARRAAAREVDSHRVYWRGIREWVAAVDQARVDAGGDA